ncbi:unnamed protein product [Leptidea sinapis]|uniref:Uncharacterized protein n=1 Tax=Leptidea sinapis TaxID=189913 RepID=A0A5E4R9Z7_9NEOP|nr:unnamed protein product [Leptidea sinapis]
MIQALIGVCGEGVRLPLLLQEIVDNLTSPEVLNKLDCGMDLTAPQIESACALLSYLGDALNSVSVAQPHRNVLYFTHVLKCIEEAQLVPYYNP